MNELLAKLSEPFAPAAITWKPGSTTKDGAKCMAMAYADLRAYQNRLDEVCGLSWSVRYVPWGNERIMCELTIDGVTRSSTGEYDAQNEKNNIEGTVAEAQAFKRAAAMFGLGRYLYDLPSVWVEFDGQRKRITEAGQTELATRYSAWYAKAKVLKLAQDKTDNNGDVLFMPDHAVERASEEQLARLNELGETYYGVQWQVVKARNVKRISGDKAQKAGELTTEQIQKLIDGIVGLMNSKATNGATK